MILDISIVATQTHPDPQEPDLEFEVIKMTQYDVDESTVSDIVMAIHGCLGRKDD